MVGLGSGKPCMSHNLPFTLAFEVLCYAGLCIYELKGWVWLSLFILCTFLVAEAMGMVAF